MKGKAIIFSAPSGSGKTTIVHGLLKKIPSLRFSISATTRPKRPIEIDGRDYHFLSVCDFKTKLKKGDILEWEEVYTNTFYGTLKNEVERIWTKGNHVIFEVDVKGGIKLKKMLGNRAISIFVKVKNEKILRERLEMRNTESHDNLNVRIKKATEEMREEIHFDKVLFNENLDDVIKEAEKIIKLFIST